VAVVLDTSSSAPHRRLAIWQDIVCDTFVGLDCRSDLHGAFWGAVAQTSVGPAAFTRVDSCAQIVQRTQARIARASEDFVLVALGNSGVNGVYQDGREAIVSTGQFVIYDTTRPYELRFDDSFFPDDFSGAAKASAPARRLVRRLDRDDFFKRPSARTIGL